MRRSISRLLCGLLLVTFGGLRLPAATGKPALRPSVAQRPITMEEWAQVRHQAEEAMNAPRGDERIARCEAFAREHPDYADLGDVLATLVDAYVETSRFDPARVANLLEQLAGLQAQGIWRLPEGLVDRYYFKYKLPLDSAERLLQKARAQVASEEAALAKISESRQKERRRQTLEMRKPHLELAEGRVRLARGDYPAAIDHLLRAESLGFASAWLGPVMRSAAQGSSRGFSAFTPAAENLNLALAQAYLRTGDRRRARQRLGQVQAFLPEYFPEIALEREQLAKELGVSSPASHEVRSEPTAAADFRLKDLDGKEVGLADFKDRVVLVMFWATW